MLNLQKTHSQFSKQKQQRSKSFKILHYEQVDMRKELVSNELEKKKAISYE